MSRLGLEPRTYGLRDRICLQNHYFVEFAAEIEGEVTHAVAIPVH
jgi:hypothetical protein